VNLALSHKVTIERTTRNTYNVDALFADGQDGFILNIGEFESKELELFKRELKALK
jgi:hypothetical protein